MKKHEKAMLFNEHIEQIINLFGNQDDQKKMEFVKNFLKEYFQIDEFDNSYIKIERLHSKSFLWLLFSLLIDFETTEETPVEALSKQNGLGDSTSPKMKILKTMGMEEKFMSLEVDDIFPFSEMTSAEARFVEYFLEKINVDLESEVKIKYIMSTQQIIFMLLGLMREHTIFQDRRGE